MSTFLVGLVFFMLYNHMLIIHFNTGGTATEKKSLSIDKKPLRLYVWHEQTWHHEDTEVLWYQNPAHTIMHAANRWFSLLDEETFHSKKIAVQNVTLSPSGTTAYISLDRYPFEAESSAYQKYMLLEGLLKTLRSLELPATHIHFLVHHKPLVDYHLDFSHPWPVKSFLEE